MSTFAVRRQEDHRQPLEIATSDAVRRVLAKAPELRIAVVGDFCLDAYWEVDVACDEVSIETGLPVTRVTGQRYGLGGAGNVAANLRALGVGEVRAIGILGDDPFGQVLTAELKAIGVNTEELRPVAGRPTPVYIKPLAGGEERGRIDLAAVSEPDQRDVDALVAALSDAALWADAVLFNQQLPTSADPRVIAAVSEIGDRTLVVADSRHGGHLLRSAVLKVNADEARRLCDRAGIAEESQDGRASALSRWAGRPVILTLGEQGLLVAVDGKVTEVPGVEVSGPVDTVGAGDTALAALGAALAAGEEAVSAGVVANLAAAIVVGKVMTTGTAGAEELASAAKTVGYVFAPGLAENPQRARHSRSGAIEVVTRVTPATIRHVVFDHDGTLSTVREGWDHVMTSLMTRVIAGRDAAGVDAAAVDAATSRRIREAAISLIGRTTGAPTMRQMEGLVELVGAFGFVPAADIATAQEYKHQYTEALNVMIDGRIRRIRDGRLEASAFHVMGTRRFLELLRERGMILHLASGTDEPAVIADATALGYVDLFDGGIHGASDDPAYDAKPDVMDRIVAGLADGETFAVFGDGPVEIREARRRSAIAVGVCSDERRRHEFDLAKRARLIRAGAELLIADYTEPEEILAQLGIS